MRVSVRNTSGRTPALDRAAILRTVAAVLAAEGMRRCDPWEVAILFVDEPAMRGENLKWRGIDRATDVISFPATEGAGGAYAGFLLGDLLIAPAVVAAHAKRYRTTEAHETAAVIVHGLLHLLGYDHDRPAARRRMLERQNSLLASLGHEAS